VYLRRQLRTLKRSPLVELTFTEIPPAGGSERDKVRLSYTEEEEEVTSFQPHQAD